MEGALGEVLVLASRLVLVPQCRLPIGTEELHHPSWLVVDFRFEHPFLDVLPEAPLELPDVPAAPLWDPGAPPDS